MSDRLTIPRLPNAEDLHFAFRGAAEASKSITVGAQLLEFLAVLAAVCAIWGADGRWLAFIAFALLGAATLGRLVVRRLRSYTHECRRTSIRALAIEADVDPLAHSEIMSSPWAFTVRLARRLPASSLVEYYTPLCPKGLQRLRELYAQSSFWTSRLLRLYGMLLWALVVICLIATIGGLYCLASTSAHAEHTREAVVIVLSSVVLGHSLIRLIDAADAATLVASRVTDIAQGLLADRVPSAKRINELAHQYDIEVCCSLDVPKWVYLLRRQSLNAQWADRRRACLPT